MDIFKHTSFKLSKQVTQVYSTSFSLATRMLKKEMRDAIYSVYGFVRFADEIVDTFHEHDKAKLLERFEADFYQAMEDGISLNPILNSFQYTVKKYNIPVEHIDAFIKSMRSDLQTNNYTNGEDIADYIYGSADVVGLMCLRIFVNGNQTQYDALKEPAMKLGSAFQKVNFLRDLKNDTLILGRSYFPEMEFNNINSQVKEALVSQINQEFKFAYEGIKKLPQRSKLAVLLAYYYYKRLLLKLKRTPAERIISERIRISNAQKIILLFKASLVYKLRLL